MKASYNTILILVLTLLSFSVFSQEYTEGASPIIDSTWFLKPQFVLHYNDETIRFTKIDSIIYKESPVQEADLAYDKSMIKKNKDSLVFLMKSKKYVFVDDSSIDKNKYGVCEYEGFLKNVKIHLVKVLGFESCIYYGIHADGSIDTLWYAEITPTISNNRIVCYQFHGDYFQLCVDTFNPVKNKFIEAWDYTLIPQQFYAFKWVDENDFFAVVSEQHKRKYYYKVSFTSD